MRNMKYTSVTVDMRATQPAHYFELSSSIGPLQAERIQMLHSILSVIQSSTHPSIHPFIDKFNLSLCISIYLPIYLSVCVSVCLSIALQPFVDLGCFFSFLICTQSVGLLGRGTSRRKDATYTQNNTNTEQMHTDIYASSGIRTHDRSV
jgi:hypothetical protein